ncbi:MAG TPA: efflux RND transporter periplasmic adaptor subunit, partial [Paralcaligenes sp.]
MAGIIRRVCSRAFWTKTKIAFFVLALCAVAAMAFWPSGPKLNYETAKVVRGDLTVTVSATGTLQPGTKVDVGTEVSGKIDQLLVDSNDHVKKGQLMAVINTDTLQAQLDQFRATLAQARATLATNQATVRQTQAKRARYHTLQDGGAVSALDIQSVDADYARAIASVSLAKGQIDSAEAQVTNTQTQIGKAKVTAPIDGVVLSRAVSVGQTVQASFSAPVLFTLASDLSVMQLSIDIDEADMGTVKEGQKATFTVDAFPNRKFDARLVTLYNSSKTTNNVVTFPGSLLVDNRSLLLRPGLTATAEILVAEVKNALLVPNAALRFTPPPVGLDNKPPPPAAKAPNGKQGGRVWVLVKNKPEARDLILGHSDGISTEVLSGNLALGDVVLTDIKSQIVRPN